MNTKKEQAILLAVLASVTAVLLCLPAGAAADKGVIYKPGAEYSFYSGAWSKNLDLDKMKPVATSVINVGRGKDSIRPAANGASFVKVKGLLKVDRAGTYRYKPGSRESEFNVMTVGGKEVSLRDLGDEEATQTSVTLAAGYHPFEIVFFKTSTPFVMTYEFDGSGRYGGMRPECFWHEVAFKKEMQTELLSAFAALKGHIQGKRQLDAKQVEAHKLTIDKHRELFGYNDTIIKAGFDLVTTYDEVNGPLWVAHEGWDRGHIRQRKEPANDIHWTIFNVMQNIMDGVYTAENVGRYADTLNGLKFGCSAHFPGAVAPPADSDKVYTVKINASNPAIVSFAPGGPAREPTGAYLAPGSVVTVTVPESLVNKGYQIRVGAHSWDHSNKRGVKRLYRSSLLYSIHSCQTEVASPLGGGIYIEVPQPADAGVVEVSIKNAVRSPYFSAKSFHKTTLKQWREAERKHKAPWADFQSDRFMMNVPTSWIYNLEDPVTLMENWDKAMDAMNDLMGQPRVTGRETMYVQVDLQNRNRNFATGYPTGNDRYDPKAEYDGNRDYYLLRGPQFAPDYVFHERGHGYLCVKFGGEMESTVNLHHVAVWHQKFGYSLDEAFAASRNMSDNKHRTVDNAAVTWMTSFNFAGGKPMNAGEKAYQLKGHAKFVDIARLFGWKCLGDFWKSYNVDVEKGIYPGRRGYKNDEISLRLSRAAGVDLTPLLHLWGIHPDDADALKAAVAGEKLPGSAKVYDALMRYKSLVPKDNKAFRDFALKWWGKQPSAQGFMTEREHAKQWGEFNEEASAQIKKRVQEIIGEYFPGGRPEKG